MNTPNESSPIKVVFIGDGNTNKTYCAKHLINDYDTLPYIPTLGVEVHCYISPNNNIYNIWDCAGQEQFKGLRSGYYIKSDMAIIFTTNTSKNKNNWKREFLRINPNGIVHCVSNATPEMIKSILQ